MKKSPGIKQIILKYLPYVILFFIIFAVYGKTAGYDITDHDDNSFIQGNTASYDSPHFLKDVFTKDVLFARGNTAYYRPMLVLSFAAGHFIAGESPHFAHLTNILLHMIACFIVFFFFKKYLTSEISAILAAVIFAVHPANIYTAVWIPGRNDSLFLIFFLLSLIFFIEYAGKRKAVFAAFHFIFFLLLLFTKESAVAVPAIFILYLITHKEKGQKILPAFIYPAIMWIAAAVFYMYLHKNAVPGTSFIQNAARCFYPENISMFFEYYASMFFLTAPFGVNITLKSFILGTAAIAFTFYIAFFKCESRTKMFFWFIIPFFLIALTMPGGRIWYQGNRMYIPLFAILCICFTCFDAFFINNKKHGKQILAAAAVFILLCSAAASVKTVNFKNGMFFWSAVYNDSINPSITIQNLYADSLLRFGYPDKAFPVIQNALESSENANLSAIYNLGNYYFILEDYEKAAHYFESAIENPVLADAQTYAELFICAKYLNNEAAAKFYYEKTSEKLNSSYEGASKYISQIMSGFGEVQKNYKGRISKNNEF